MTQLNTAISTGIRSVIISEFMPNAYTLEKQLHKANKEHRLNGEWFREIVDFCDVEFSYLEGNLLKNKDFFFMFQQSLKLIASCEELNGTDLKVFMFLLSELDFENYIRVTQKRIVEHTKIKQQHVSTALTKLTKTQHYRKSHARQSENLSPQSKLRLERQNQFVSKRRKRTQTTGH